jgi:putative ABC transport system permease protein
MFQSYVLLREGQQPSDLEKLFPAFAEKYINHNAQADGAVNMFLQPLTGIHLQSNLVGEVETNGSITYVYILSGIALCILVLACFNFVNLSTVHSLSRAKEIGLRKSVGAQRGQLIRQFLGEAVLVTILSSLAAVIAAWGVLPIVNVLFHKNLTLLTFANPVSIIIAVAFILLIGIATGIYPSLVLTSFKPTEVLKGKFAKTIGGNLTRRSLVIFQFASAIVLVACTLTLYQQLDFVKNKELGFDKSQSVILTLPRSIEASRIEEFKKMLMNNASVMSVAAASSVPSSNLPINLVRQEGSVNNESHSFEMIFADLDFIKTAGMKVIAGRDFSPDFTTDPEQAFIINEEAVKELGWTPQEAVGKKFDWVSPTSVIKSGHIIGVIANVNFRPLNFKVQPMVIHHRSARFQYCYVNFQPGNIATQVQTLEAEFKKAFPAQPFEFTFLDQTIQHLYDHERTLGSIFIYSSGLAIVIAVLGIFALAMHAASRRVKEIGIRKVLGATNGQILRLSVREFVMLIALANLVALPLAFYLMSRWLALYAYRVGVDWRVLITSGLLIFFVALITVSVQAIQSARANPVKSLRSE